jgi:glycosyltransferase 2 family protein
MAKARLQKLAKLASPALTVASLLLVGVWLFTRRHELAAVPWAGVWPLFLLLVAMYGISLLLNFAVWHSCMAAVSPIGWLKDLEVYAYSNLSRRLPSGLGYFLVRSIRYHGQGIEAGNVIYFSLLELTLQVVTGAGLAIALSLASAAASTGTYLALAAVAALFALASRPEILSRLLGRISRRPLGLPGGFLRRMAWRWLLMYAVTWINGGIMLYLLLQVMTGRTIAGLGEITGLWAMSGTLGLVSGMIPIGQLARDAALALLLQKYLPLPVAVATALVFRCALTAGDVFWSPVLLVGSLLTQKRYCSQRT